MLGLQNFARPFLAAGFVILAASAANAGWISLLGREAATAGKAASHLHPNLGSLGRAVEHIHGIPGAPKGALAAHATPEGHWQFANREGQTFTAGTPDEFKHVMSSLAPDAAKAADGKVSLFLSEDSLFENRKFLDQLPKDADLHIVTEGGGAYPIVRKGDLKTGSYHASISPNLTIELADHALFGETVANLARPLNKANIRTLALEPGASKTLSSAPRIDPATKTALVDQIDPAQLSASLRSIRGQTALVAGRVENGKLFIQPSKGAEFSHDLAELKAAAAEADVNLVILHTDAARQPGGRNWLWQKVSVGGLDDALSKATFGDFLEAMGAKRGGFTLTPKIEGNGRINIAAAAQPESRNVASHASDIISELVQHVTGEAIGQSVDISARDKSSQSEIDAQLIPGIPSYIQLPYLISIFVGLLAHVTAGSWFQRIWPRAPRSDGQGKTAYFATGLPRGLVYLLMFLPVAGFPALMWQMMVQTWQTIMAPFRWLKRKFGRAEV